MAAVEEDPYESASDASFESVDLSDVEDEDVPSDSVHRLDTNPLTQAEYAKGADNVPPSPLARKSVPSLAQRMAQMRASREKRLSLSSNTQPPAAASSAVKSSAPLAVSLDDSEESASNEDIPATTNPPLVPKKPASAAERRGIQRTSNKKASINTKNLRKTGDVVKPQKKGMQIRTDPVDISEETDALVDRQSEDVDVDMEDIDEEDDANNDIGKDLADDADLAPAKELLFSNVTPASDQSEEHKPAGEATAKQKPPRSKLLKSVRTTVKAVTSTISKSGGEDTPKESDDSTALNKSPAKFPRKKSSQSAPNARKKDDRLGSDNEVQENILKDENNAKTVIDSGMGESDVVDSDDDIVFHTGSMLQRPSTAETPQKVATRMQLEDGPKELSASIPKNAHESDEDQELIPNNPNIELEGTERGELLGTKEPVAETRTARKKAKSGVKKANTDSAEQSDSAHVEIKKVVHSRKKRSVLSKELSDRDWTKGVEDDLDADDQPKVSKGTIKPEKKRALKKKLSSSSNVESRHAEQAEMSSKAPDLPEHVSNGVGGESDAELPPKSQPRSEKATARSKGHKDAEINHLSNGSELPRDLWADKVPANLNPVIEGDGGKLGHVKMYLTPENGKPFYIHPRTGVKVGGMAAQNVMRNLEKSAKKGHAQAPSQQSAPLEGDISAVDNDSEAGPSMTPNNEGKSSSSGQQKQSKAKESKNLKSSKVALKDTRNGPVSDAGHESPVQTETNDSWRNRKVKGPGVSPKGAKGDPKPQIANAEDREKLQKSIQRTLNPMDESNGQHELTVKSGSALKSVAVGGIENEDVQEVSVNERLQSQPYTDTDTEMREVASEDQQEAADASKPQLNDEPKASIPEIGNEAVESEDSGKFRMENQEVDFDRQDSAVYADRTVPNSRERRSSEPWKSVSSGSRRRSFGSSTVNTTNMHHGKQLFRKVEDHFELFTQWLHESVDQFVSNCKKDMGGTEADDCDVSRPWKASRRQRLEVRVKAMEKEAQLQMWDCMKRLATGIAGVIEEEAVPDISLAETFSESQTTVPQFGDARNLGDDISPDENVKHGVKRKLDAQRSVASPASKNAGPSSSKRAKLHNKGASKASNQLVQPLDDLGETETGGRSQKVHWKESNDSSVDGSKSGVQSVVEGGKKAGKDVLSSGSQSRRKSGTAPVKLIGSDPEKVQAVRSMDIATESVDIVPRMESVDAMKRFAGSDVDAASGKDLRSAALLKLCKCPEGRPLSFLELVLPLSEKNIRARINKLSKAGLVTGEWRLERDENGVDVKTMFYKTADNVIDS